MPAAAGHAVRRSFVLGTSARKRLSGFGADDPWLNPTVEVPKPPLDESLPLAGASLQTSEPPSRPGLVARTTSWSKQKAASATAWTLGARETHRTVDAGFRAADRDKRVAAGVLAGGVAYRFFFWILAASLLANGAIGFIDGQQIQEALESMGVDSGIAESLRGSAEPSDTARWWLLAVGFWLVLWTGYLGAKAVVLVHAAVWGMQPPPIHRRLVASGAFTGVVLVFIASMAAAQWLRTTFPDLRLLTTLVVVVVPFAGWLLISQWLPHQDAGLMALVPGAALVAIGIQGLHLFTVFFLGPKLVNATELYGVLGIVSTILFWLYITGRLVIGAATINASLYEQDAATASNATPLMPGGGGAGTARSTPTIAGSTADPASGSSSGPDAESARYQPRQPPS